MESFARFGLLQLTTFYPCCLAITHKDSSSTPLVGCFHLGTNTLCYKGLAFYTSARETIPLPGRVRSSKRRRFGFPGECCSVVRCFRIGHSSPALLANDGVKPTAATAARSPSE